MIIVHISGLRSSYPIDTFNYPLCEMDLENKMIFEASHLFEENSWGMIGWSASYMMNRTSLPILAVDEEDYYRDLED